MAVYTQLSKAELADMVDDYGLVKLIARIGNPQRIRQHELPSRDDARHAICSASTR